MHPAVILDKFSSVFWLGYGMGISYKEVLVGIVTAEGFQRFIRDLYEDDRFKKYERYRMNRNFF